MSHRFGPPLITGSHIHGNSGLGVLAELVPSSGEHGAGYLYDSLELPADNGKEVRGLITTWPTLGTLTAFEDSSFEYEGPTDSFAFQMYVDGVAVGTPQTATVAVGEQVFITAITASNITQTTVRITVSRLNPAAGTLYLVIVPQGVVPSWSRANIATNSGWSGSPVYHDADTDPGTGSTYQFVPDVSGLTGDTAYEVHVVWDDGETTVGPVQGTGFTTAAVFVSISGSMLATESGADTFAASGAVIGTDQITGTMSAKESGADTFAASGDVIVDNQITGTLAAQEEVADTAVIAGAVLISGSLSATEIGADTVSATGNFLITGALSAVEQGADTALIVGADNQTGYLIAQESNRDSLLSYGETYQTDVSNTSPSANNQVQINSIKSLVNYSTNASLIYLNNSAGLIGSSRSRKNPH